MKFRQKTTITTISGSPRGWRVLLACAFKGLDYDVNYLSFENSEHKSKPFLELNPRGRVPVLEDSGQIITDSLGAMIWLDQQYPQKPIFGHRDDERARVLCDLFRLRDFLRPAVSSCLTPIFFPKSSTESQAVSSKQANAERLLSELKEVDRQLIDRRYISSAAPSASDAICFPEIMLLDRALTQFPEEIASLGLGHMFDEMPHMNRWKQDLLSSPDVEATLPPHWSVSQ